MHYWFSSIFGGIHKHFKVVPDMVIYGKAIGNGYAITTVLGKRIMKKADQSFISVHFGLKGLDQQLL